MSEPVAGSERTYTIGFALASLEGLSADTPIQQALRESWMPGATIVRYGRRWYLTRLLESVDDLRYGRIGFVRKGVVPTVFFDASAADFVRGGAPSGTIVPFVISASTGTIAYQIRPDTVPERTFIGALRALLNLNEHLYSWSIQPLVEDSEYDTWIAGVSQVTEFHFKLERANPHYSDDELVERIIEEFRLKYAVLTGVAVEGEGVDTESPAFRQALDHVLRGYGTASLIALDRQGGESLWVRTRGLIGAVTSRRRIRSVGDEEAPVSALREAMEQTPAGALAADLSDDDDDEPSTP
jgi:hypothetical protein